MADDHPSALLGPAAGRVGGLVLAGAAVAALLSSSFVLRLAAAWVAAEAAYFLLFRQRYAAINTIIHHPADPAAAAAHMARFLDLAPVMCIREFMSGWFRGAPFSDVQRGNVQDFVAYGFYQSTWEGLDAQDAATASAFVDAVEAAWGIAYPPGRNEGLTFMAHLWEPLRAVPKPLAVHAAAEVGLLACRLALWGMGFSRRAVPGGSGFEYWVRKQRVVEGKAAAAAEETPLATPTPTPPPSPPRPLAGFARPPSPTAATTPLARGDSVTSLAGGSTRGVPPFLQAGGAKPATAPAAAPTAPSTTPALPPRPIAFIHGVGLGIFPYLGLVWQMVASHGCDRDILLLEVPHVALGAAPRRAAPVDAVADAAVAMLGAEGHPSACFAAHSYGTFCVSRARQRHPAAVASTLLMDPVCLLTCHPRLLHSFVYHAPGLAALIKGGVREVLGGVRFLFSRDLTIAETFCRQFLWHELMLWPDALPEATLVALAHSDDLVPSPLVARHLANAAPGAHVMYHPSAGHGGVLLDWGWQAGMVEAMAPLLEVKAGGALAAPPKAAAPPVAPVRSFVAPLALPRPAAVAPSPPTTPPSSRRRASSAADDTAGEGDAQPRGQQSSHRRRTGHRRRPSALISAGHAGGSGDCGALLDAADAAAATAPRRLFRRMAVKQAGHGAEAEAAARVRA